MLQVLDNMEASCVSCVKVGTLDQLEQSNICFLSDSKMGIIISNNSNLRQKHQGVPDGSDGSDRTSYPLTENYTLPVAQATGRVAHVLLYFVVTFTHDQKDTCVALFAEAAVMLKPFT